mmetsp:Transcript_107546/g.195625  ORF Transcript_107546/g.195625 Transcript_107546/m.195625 type:complete len:260 (+) Transcript_107546:2462-3241(+)
MSFTPFRLVAQRLFPVKVDSVTLKICIVDDVYTILVTQIIPLRIVRIMGATHCIEIVQLHQADVFYACLSSNIVPFERVVLVPIHSTNGELLAVQQQATLSYLHRPETNLQSDSLRPWEAHYEKVQRWRLSAPLRNVGHRKSTASNCSARSPHFQRHLEGADAAGGHCSQRLAARWLCEELAGESRAGWKLGTSRHLGIYFQQSIARRSHFDVADIALRPRMNVDIPRDACKPPHVLIFQVGSSTPTQDLQGYRVFPTN